MIGKGHYKFDKLDNVKLDPLSRDIEETRQIGKSRNQIYNFYIIDVKTNLKTECILELDIQYSTHLREVFNSKKKKGSHSLLWG